MFFQLFAKYLPISMLIRMKKRKERERERREKGINLRNLFRLKN